MENIEIARIFEEIADLLEIKGDDHFRIRSYRNAAAAVIGLTEELKSLYASGEERLKGVHGIGDRTRKKIIEMLTTGACSVHDELLHELTPGVLEMLKVSGVGPKKAHLFHKELGISGIDELLSAAESQRLRVLPGMGELSEGKILSAIKDLKSMVGQFNIGAALAIALPYVEYLKSAEGVIDVMPAGSIRRWKDTIGDIDILALSDGSKTVMERFVSYPEVADVIARGETKSSVRLKSGINVDIRVFTDRSAIGSAIQHFTGSKEHNVALRDRAKRMGQKISEYGVFTLDGDARVAGETESEVYASVGLKWIPPELREDRGEIEAAATGGLPVQLEVSDIKGDLHLHTNESDGGNTLAEIAEAALSRGYEYAAITDHTRAVAIANGLDRRRLLSQILAIDGFNEGMKRQGKGFRLLKGTEVDILADGSLDMPVDVLKRLDCVVGSVHSSFRMAPDEMTERIITAIRSGLLHIIAHPTGRLIGVRVPYLFDMGKVMAEAAKFKVALEINSYPMRLDLGDAHCRMAKEKGVKVAISTDAHMLSQMDNIVYGVHTARRGWLEKGDVINTMPLEDLMKFLKR